MDIVNSRNSRGIGIIDSRNNRIIIIVEIIERII